MVYNGNPIKKGDFGVPRHRSCTLLSLLPPRERRWGAAGGFFKERDVVGRWYSMVQYLASIELVESFS